MKDFVSCISVVIISFLSSCINEKYIYKCNTLYEVESLPANPQGTEPTSQFDSLIIRRPKEGFQAVITDKVDYLIIKKKKGDKVTFDVNKIYLTNALTGVRAENVGKYYFPELDLDISSRPPFKLKYFDTKPVLQALTIPLKIRPKLSDPVLKDSFPSQAETSFNVGIAMGWKFTHNVYNSHKNIFGQNTNRYSLSPGMFVGTGAIDLKKTITRNPTITFERKAAIITTGGFLMLGFNSINFGYAFGADFATGTGSKQWLYQGKIWHGVIFAIDVLK